MVEIYTDGSCRKNGKGGWGIAVFEDNKLIGTTGEQKDNTTNNEMELTAILFAFKMMQTLEYKNKIATIYSDSAYSVNSINEWIYTWAKNNWVTSTNTPVKNLEIMKELYEYINIPFFNCQVVKIKGHANHVGNEIADAIATDNNKKLQKLLSN